MPVQTECLLFGPDNLQFAADLSALIIDYEKAGENHLEEFVFSACIPPEKIGLFNKLADGYDNLLYVSTIDPANGLLILHTSASASKTVIKILSKFPFPVIFSL